MGIVARPYGAVVFLMLLTLGGCLGLPAEDVLGAFYDESESVPFESTPAVSIAVHEFVAETSCVRCGASKSRRNSLRGSITQRSHRTRTGWLQPISNSLTILDHSLRC